MEKYILSVTVQNNAGVLARVSSLFGRRGYNIDSLTVSATTDPKVSCMSIIVQGDHMVLEQIMKQLAKLEEVMHVVHLEEDSSCCSELVFVKLHTPDVSVRSDIRQLCELYGARVEEREIEDHFGNQTSFALIGRQGHPPVFTGDRYKTSLALFLQVDRAGTLNMILSEFAYAGINLSMIQSRPTKQALGDYMFFIEFKEDANTLPVQTALNCLRLKLREVKVLGSYPVD